MVLCVLTSNQHDSINMCAHMLIICLSTVGTWEKIITGLFHTSLTIATRQEKAMPFILFRITSFIFYGKCTLENTWAALKKEETIECTLSSISVICNITFVCISSYFLLSTHLILWCRSILNTFLWRLFAPKHKLKNINPGNIFW